MFNDAELSDKKDYLNGRYSGIPVPEIAEIFENS
jgi:hypothetical protein